MSADLDRLLYDFEAGPQDPEVRDALYRVASRSGQLGRVLDALASWGLQGEKIFKAWAPTAPLLVAEAFRSPLVCLIAWDGILWGDPVAARAVAAMGRHAAPLRVSVLRQAAYNHPKEFFDAWERMASKTAEALCRLTSCMSVHRSPGGLDINSQLRIAEFALTVPAWEFFEGSDHTGRIRFQLALVVFQATVRLNVEVWDREPTPGLLLHVLGPLLSRSSKSVAREDVIEFLNDVDEPLAEVRKRVEQEF